MNAEGDTIWARSYGDSLGAITSMEELSNNDLIISGNPVEPNNYNFFR
ncbi:MAG: hypothetical protein R2764_07600 [Bacteroidales bacterium]